MSETKARRDFLRVLALAAIALPYVHAAENDTIQLALIGCGDRGTGAVENAFHIQNGPVKLAAMADVFPQERQFIGFDGYRHAMDALKPGDVAILATPPAFRRVHFRYAIDKGLNVVMEKPVTVDGPTTRRMIALGQEAGRKNLKVGVGLMVRYSRARQELLNRVRGGQIGDIVAMRGYRMGSGGGVHRRCAPAATASMLCPSRGSRRRGSLE